MRVVNSMSILRLGVPGGNAFPFEITAPGNEKVIVYAATTLEAATIFSEAMHTDLFDIRVMSDNE